MAKGSDDGKIFAFLAIFLGIIGFIIVLVAKKDNKYAMYYAKQSLVLFVVCIGVWILGMIPFIGWFIIAPIGMLCVLILWIIGIVYSLSGQEKPLPIIGKYADKINL